MAKRQVALVWAVCLVALAVGCKGCAGPEEPAAGESDEYDEAEMGGVSGGILRLDLSVTGQRDEAGRYLSTVSLNAVSAPKGTLRLGCNGVLVAANLVLTAAHCVCAPRHGEPGQIDGSECASQAEVRVQYWDHSVDGGGRTGWRDEIAGDILIHPRFQLVLDSQGAVVSSRADLAVIRLKRLVPPVVEPIRLATEEVQVGEVVSVVGFGHDDMGYATGSSCWFNREKVQTPVGEDRLLFGSMDQAAYKGDTGGPALRETKQGLELVGISQRGLGRAPTFTRIAPYREWLEEQIRVASGKH